VTLRFWAHSGGLGATYAVLLMLIGKPVVDFLFMLVELFSLSARLRLTRYGQIWIETWRFEGVGPVSVKISRRWDVHHQRFFARLDRPINAIQLCCWEYSHKGTLANFLQVKCTFRWKTDILLFEPYLWSLGETYTRCSS